MAEIASEFFPPGVFNVICGDRDTGRALVTHPTPQMVAITGSVRAGMEVASAAAADLKRVHLELGGKAPVIVFDDADIALAAETIAVGGYFNAGQDCTAATRVIASPKAYADVVDALAEQAKGTKTGMPDDEDVLFGPLNNANQYERVAAMVDAAPGHARLAAGGHRIAGPGFFYEPTVISDLRQDDDMIQNEIFGPVITVQPFGDEDEAVKWANGVQYGLASSVWTHEPRPRDARRRAGSTSAASGSTRTSRSSPRCRTAASSTPATARICRMYGLEDYTRIKHVMSNLDA